VRIVCIGGGPAGLYFSLLVKKADPAADVLVLERNRPDDTFGFGVVFSDATLENLAAADGPSHEAISRSFWHWDDIDIHFKGHVLTSTGHGFAGMSRKALLQILQRRCAEVGVEMRFQEDVSDLGPWKDADLVVASDGVNSGIRSALASSFEPQVDFRPNKFVWLGTTFPFRAFTFYFKQSEHGLFRVHAYRYDPSHSTFIVECTDRTFEKTGLDPADEDATVRYCEELFATELAGHQLLKNRSNWRNFPNVKCRRWSTDNIVLLGDAVHTAHFSVGSGTKLAMEDAIALAQALGEHRKLTVALSAYETARRPAVESLQRSAQVSLEWFENTERYADLDPQSFAMSLLTRSLRVTHANLARRDPQFVARFDRWYADRAARAAGRPVPPLPSPPPMFTPFKVRDLVLDNRVVVSPMCQYSAEGGTIDDWHLVHLGSRALGGASLVITEMTDVSADGRISPGCAGMYEPAHVAAWRRVTKFVHTHATAKIGIQLAHAGRKGSTRRPWEGAEDEPLPQGNWTLLAPSPLPWRVGSNHVPREMDRADMDHVKADFVRATEMAVEAGFDWLELHYAHGYLLASFLSPLTNRRTDGYGGPLENRLRYPLEVLDAVRAAWPAERPLSVRISAVDWAPGGNEAADAVHISRALGRHGADVIDVSTGQTAPESSPVYGRLYQTPFAERIRLETGLPVMTVGGISSWADVNSVLAADRADLAVLARAHLYDPYWTRHAATEQGVTLEWPKQYAKVARFRPR